MFSKWMGLGCAVFTSSVVMAGSGPSVSPSTLYANANLSSFQVIDLARNALADRSAFMWLEKRRNGGEQSLVTANRFNRGGIEHLDVYTASLVADIKRDSHYFGVLYGYGRSIGKPASDFKLKSNHYLLRVFGEEDFDCFVAKASAEYMYSASSTGIPDEGRMKAHSYGVDFGLESRMRFGSFAIMPYVGVNLTVLDPKDMAQSRPDQQKVAEFPLGIRFGFRKEFETSSFEALVDACYIRASGDLDAVVASSSDVRVVAKERGEASLTLRAQFEHANVDVRYGYTRASGDRDVHDVSLGLGYLF